MSDDYHSILVTFDRDLAEEEVNALEAALRQFKHVIGVHRNATDFNVIMAHDRAKRELGQKLWEILYPRDKA